MENKEKCYHCGSEKIIKEKQKETIKISKLGGYTNYPLQSMICLECGTISRLFIDLK